MADFDPREGEEYEMKENKTMVETNEAANTEYKEELNNDRSSVLQPWDTSFIDGFDPVKSWSYHKDILNIKDLPIPEESIIKDMDKESLGKKNLEDKRAAIINNTQTLRHILENSDWFKNLNDSKKNSEGEGFKDFVIDRIMDSKRNLIVTEKGKLGYEKNIKDTDIVKDVPVLSFENGEFKIVDKNGKPVTTAIQAAKALGYKGPSLVEDFKNLDKTGKIADTSNKILDGEEVQMQEIKNIKVNNEPGFLSGEMKKTALDLNLHKKNLADAEAVINGTTDVIPEDVNAETRDLLTKLENNREQIRKLEDKLENSVDKEEIKKSIERQVEIQRGIREGLIREKQRLEEKVQGLENKLRQQLETRENSMTLKEKIYDKLKKGLTVAALMSVIGLLIADIATKISAATGSSGSSGGNKETKGESGDSPIIAAAKTILKNVGKFVSWLLKMLGKAFVFMGKYSVLFIFFVVTAILGYIISRGIN